MTLGEKTSDRENDVHLVDIGHHPVYVVLSSFNVNEIDYDSEYGPQLSACKIFQIIEAV